MGLTNQTVSLYLHLDSMFSGLTNAMLANDSYSLTNQSIKLNILKNKLRVAISS